MDRRSCLAGVAAFLTAGCSALQGDGSGETETLSPPQVPASSPSPSPTPGETADIHGGGSSTTIWLTEVTPAAIAERHSTALSALERPHRALVREAIESGSATHTSYLHHRLPQTGAIEHEGAYYRVQTTETGSRELTGRRLEVEALTSCRGPRTTPERTLTEFYSPTPTPTRIAFEDLPAADREALLALARTHFQSDDCFSAGWVYVYPSEAAVSESVLVSDGRTVVHYEGDDYRVTSDGEATVTETTLEYDTTLVASSWPAFVDAVVDRRVTDLTGELAPRERRFFRRLREAGELQWDRTEPPLEARAFLRQARGPYIYYAGTYYRVTQTTATA